MNPTEERRIVRTLDDFVFNNDELSSQQIGKLDDRLAAIEETFLQVSQVHVFVVTDYIRNKFAENH